MTLTLRSVGRDDLGPLARVHASCFPEDPWDAAALAEVMAMTGAEARLAEEENRPVGLLFATIVGEEAEILTFGVAPAARRRGVGRALLAISTRGRGRLAPIGSCSRSRPTTARRSRFTKARDSAPSGCGTAITSASAGRRSTLGSCAVPCRRGQLIPGPPQVSP